MTEDEEFEALEQRLNYKHQEKSKPVQVSPLEFVTMVLEKEHLVGQPIIWAEWPNKKGVDMTDN